MEIKLAASIDLWKTHHTRLAENIGSVQDILCCPEHDVDLVAFYHYINNTWYRWSRSDACPSYYSSNLRLRGLNQNGLNYPTDIVVMNMSLDIVGRYKPEGLQCVCVQP